MKELLKQITFFAPQTKGFDLEEFLQEKSALDARPFEEKRIQSLSQLSQAILNDSFLKKDASCVALGYWLRRANLLKLQQQFEKSQKLETEICFVPAGKVFHITPANVDTIFVYSWALSYLCGNSNIVRLSTKPSPVVESLLRVFLERMKTDEILARNNLFLTYEHNPKISELFSLWCSHRIVWGGDETAKNLRSVTLNPHASERVFASKFSYAVFSLKEWLSASAEQHAKTAAAFFNDAFWFGQMACSSPHVIFWSGEKSQMNSAISSFESALEKELKKRKHAGDASTSIKRLSFSFKLAAQSDVRVRLHEGSFVSVEQLDRKELDKEICGGGVFRHVQVNRLEQIAEFADEKDQTVTHFGLSKEELHSLATTLGVRGVDRIVPIGEALAFDVNWDGYNLVQDFLRRVVVRG